MAISEAGKGEKKATRNRILGPEATGYKTMGEGKKKESTTWVRDRIELESDRTQPS